MFLESCSSHHVVVLHLIVFLLNQYFCSTHHVFRPNTYVPLRKSCMFTLSLPNTSIFNYYLCSIHHVFGTTTYIPLIMHVFSFQPELFCYFFSYPTISTTLRLTPFTPWSPRRKGQDFQEMWQQKDVTLTDCHRTTPFLVGSVFQVEAWWKGKIGGSWMRGWCDNELQYPQSLHVATCRLQENQFCKAIILSGVKTGGPQPQWLQSTPKSDPSTATMCWRSGYSTNTRSSHLYIIL